MGTNTLMGTFVVLFVGMTGGIFCALLWCMAKIEGWRLAYGDGPEPVVGLLMLTVSAYCGWYSAGYVTLLLDRSVCRVREYLRACVTKEVRGGR